MAEDDRLRLQRTAGWIREEIDRNAGSPPTSNRAGTRAPPR